MEREKNETGIRISMHFLKLTRLAFSWNVRDARLFGGTEEALCLTLVRIKIVSVPSPKLRVWGYIRCRYFSLFLQQPNFGIALSLWRCILCRYCNTKKGILHNNTFCLWQKISRVSSARFFIRGFLSTRKKPLDKGGQNSGKKYWIWQALSKYREKYFVV